MPGSRPPSAPAPTLAVRRLPASALASGFLRWDSAWHAAAGYLIATLVLTWPLARGLASDIPADTGDSLLNSWILAWGAEHVLRFAGGDLQAFDGFWTGNFFHPARLTLAYSEHMFPQALQVAPVYALTGNVILCYNLVFLSTFVLCGLGTYLLVRELTGDGRAAFLAGLFFAFTPYRIAQFPHVQVLSIQWMPFALYGLARYAKRGGLRPLVGSSAALLAQNLSCGYFLLYFGPFAAAYGACAILWWRRPALVADGEAGAGRFRGRLAGLAGLALAFGLVGALTLPFLLPYMDLRALGFPPRPLGEVILYSADVRSYLSAPTTLHGTARFFQAFPKPEGELFPGVVPLALAAAAVLLAWRDVRRERRLAREPGVYGFGLLRAPERAGRLVSGLLVAVIAVEAAAALFVLAVGPQVLHLAGTAIRLRELGRLVTFAAAATVLLALWSGPARATLRRMVGPVGFWAAAAAVAAVLSLGPIMKTGGLPVGDGPYHLLHGHVPGYDGIRVPARLGLEVALFVAILAGYALAQAPRLSPSKVSRPLLLLFGLGFLVEVWPPPILINHTDPVERAVTPPSPVPYGSETPRVYPYLAGLPRGTVVLEMPFGQDGYELRYLFYSTLHWQPLVNGYSGGVPDQYYRLRLSLGHPVRNWDRAWEALVASTAEVVVVHERAYLEDQGPRVSAWLEHHGARRLASFDGDAVFAMPGIAVTGLAPRGGKTLGGR